MISKLVKRTFIVTLAFHKMALAERVRDFDSIIGADAASLGGAYTAISEDASGVFYNPGGIAFSKTQGVSLTSSSLDRNELFYENALGNRDLIIKSGGFDSNFLGSTFSLSPFGFSNWYGAFGIFSIGSSVTNQELKGENNQVQSIFLDKTYVAIKDEIKNTSYSLALSYLFTSQLGAGITLGMNSDTDSKQQFFNFCFKDANAQGKLKDLKSCIAANGIEKDQHDHAFIIMGVRWELDPKTSIGLSIRGGRTLTRKFMKSSFGNQTLLNSDGTYASAEDLESADQAKYKITESKENIDYGKENIPLNGRLGLASTFFDSRFLMTSDVMYFHKIAATKSTSAKKSTFNYALGIRYHMNPKSSISSGVFTNNDFREKPKDINTSREKTDYTGGTMSVSYLFGATLGYITAIHQYGKGYAVPIQLGEVQPVVNTKGIKRVLMLGIESRLN